MIIDELVNVLGYEVKGEAQAKRFFNSMDKFANGAARMAKAVAAAGAAAVAAFSAMGAGMFALSKSAAAELDPLVKFADRVNVNIESVQAWQFAAEQSGASAGEFRTSLETLSKSLGEVARGTGRAKLAFDDYGISAKDANGNIKTADVMLLELTDKFQTLSNQQQIDLGQKLGMTPGMITLLRSGRQAIEAYQNQARDGGLIFTEKEARNAERFNDAMSLFEKSIKAIKYRIGVEFLPVLSDTLDRMQAWIGANQDLIRTNITLWSGRVVSSMKTLSSSFDSVKNAAKGIGGVIASAVKSISGGKIDLGDWEALAASLGVIAAFKFPKVVGLLGLDDLARSIQGKSSLIGDFADSLSEITGIDADKLEKLFQVLEGAAIGLLIFPGAMKGVAKAIKGLAGAVALFGTGTAAASGSGVLMGLLGALGVATVPTNNRNLSDFVPNDDAEQAILDDARKRLAEIPAWDLSNDGSDIINEAFEKRRVHRDKIGYKPEYNVPKSPRPERVGGTPAESFDLGRFDNVPVSGNDNLAQQMKNFTANMSKINGPNAAAAVNNTMNDNRVTNQTFNNTVNQTVTQATNAPEEAARATSNAVSKNLQGLDPARMNGGGGF